MSPQMIVIKSGAWLIGCGIVILAMELLIEALGWFSRQTQRMDSRLASLRTSYAGVIVIALGVMLETIGSLALKN